MGEMNNCAKTSDADLKAMKTKCWNPDCKSRAFLRDWAGWQWCFRDWWRMIRDKDNFKLFYLTHTKIFFK